MPSSAQANNTPTRALHDARPRGRARREVAKPSEYWVRPRTGALALDEFEVLKKGDGSVYHVRLREGTCDCRGYRHFSRCKHLHLVYQFLKSVRGEEVTREVPVQRFREELAVGQVTDSDVAIVADDSLAVSLTEGTLINLETTGLDPDLDEILTLGYVTGNRLRVVQRKTLSYPAFRTLLQREMRELPPPHTAYHASFDEAFLEKQLRTGFEFRDLREPWGRRTGRRLGPRLDDIVPSPARLLGERRITGSDVPRLWKRYTVTRDPALLERIIRHTQIHLVQAMGALCFESIIR